MLWRIGIIIFIAGTLWGQGPKRIAVCGVSRNSEELEMALELNPKILVQKCGARNLDAWVKVSSKSVDAYREQEILWSQSLSGSILSEKKAKSVAERILKMLAVPQAIKNIAKQNPAPVQSKPIAPIINNEPPKEIALETSGMLLDEAFMSDSAETQREAERILSGWTLETGASVDQWNAGLSTKAYPGFKLKTAFVFAGSWQLEGSFAFGASAFRLDEQVAWSQQLVGALTFARNFDVGKGVSLGVGSGYFYWISLSDSAALPRFSLHDLPLGVTASHRLKSIGLEFNAAVHFLPVGLGLNSELGMRYHFVSNWYASLQGQAVSLWANGREGSFLTAFLGLGCSL